MRPNLGILVADYSGSEWDATNPYVTTLRDSVNNSDVVPISINMIVDPIELPVVLALLSLKGLL